MVTPYRTLAAADRLRLVTHDIETNRESRNAFVQAIVKRGGGFRPEKLRKWPADQLAREVVRHNLEMPQDELRLLILLYVDLEPALQIDFLDAAGVAHTAGHIAEDLEPPFAPNASVSSAAAMVREKYPERAEHYLRTIALYNPEAWPGLEVT